jgi:hypothetical protein
MTVKRSETVVLKLMSSKLFIVMSGIFDRARQYNANGGIIKKWCHFLTTAGQNDHFLAQQMVNFSSLHDD